MAFTNPKIEDIPICQVTDFTIFTTVSKRLASILLITAALPISAYAAPNYPLDLAPPTTRQQTVRPIAITSPSAPELNLSVVPDFAAAGYTSWLWGGPALDAGPILPGPGALGSYTAEETLLTFFSITDVHITDKESPAQIPGDAMDGRPDGAFGTANTSSYSPVIMSTTQVLDAAVQTINALHAQTPFDFGIALGDAINNTQYNELRWYIDVLDGKMITPSSGAHRGAKSIDYQKSFKAAGLDKSIPWYQVLGNHDQYWCGTLNYNDYARKALVGKYVMNLGFDENDFPTFAARGFYVGVVDGKTEYGSVIDYGDETNQPTPTVAADSKRHSLSTPTSNSLNWMKGFFNTTSKPKGHGFTQTNLDNDFASYTFEPKANLPLKVIVLDDTCKPNPYAAKSAYARGCLDQERYDWLVNELDKGQSEGKLMIIAAHVPVGPIMNNSDIPAGALPNDTVVPLFIGTCNSNPDQPGNHCPYSQPISDNLPIPPYSVVTDAMLLTKLHNYSNLLLWISGHRHQNTVTPQPSPSSDHPEFGFWEVETASLRDFPQEFRTFQLIRNSNNTLSIVITNVDPAVQADPSLPPATPAAKSRGYAIAANRIASGNLTDTGSHAYNAELIKVLPEPYTLTMTVVGEGRVTSSPYSGLSCTAETSPCTATFLPGTTISLVATPTAEGASLSGWSGTSGCYGTSNCTITLNGSTDVQATFIQAPILAASPDYKNFGNKKLGKTAKARFSVKNIAKPGAPDLIIDTVSIDQTDPAQFTVVSDKDLCSGKTLKPGKSCRFDVAFTPSSVNTQSATIAITSNDLDSPQVIQLTGVGK